MRFLHLWFWVCCCLRSHLRRSPRCVRQRDSCCEIRSGNFETRFPVLKRQRTSRGPYTDQDDPLLLAEQSKENAHTGLNPNELSCRPPHCSREDARLIIKLATPARVQELAKATGNSSKHSAYFVDTSLTPIFSQSQVTKARAKLASTRTKMPLNSMGKPVDLMRWRSLALPAGTDLDEAIADLSLDPRVEVVESSFERQLKGEPSKSGTDRSMSSLAIAQMAKERRTMGA